MSPVERLPAVRCLPASGGQVQAEAGMPPWPEIPAQSLQAISGGPPQQATSFKLCSTERGLRVLIRCEDAAIQATMTTRGAPLYEEEVVEIFLDPFGDLACYFEIEVNPLNAVLEVLLRRGRSGYRKDFRWRCAGLQTAVRRDPGGWTVELEIPFAALTPAPPKPGDSWRANFLRIDRPPNAPRELSAWSPTHCGTFHVPERFGWIHFA